VFTLYADILYLLAIFVVVAVAAIIGLWRHNAGSETSAVRPIVLSDDIRADFLRVRNKAVQEAMDAKRVRKTEYRKSIRASRTPVKSEDTAETIEVSCASGLNDQNTTKAPNPKTPGPAAS